MVDPKFSYFLNGVLMATDTLFMTINPGDSVEHTFTQTADMSVQNDYTIHTLVTSTGDANAADDVATLRIWQITGIDQVRNNIGVTVMPNPSNGQFKVSVSGVSGKVSLTVFDLQGKEVYSKNDESQSSKYETQIDLGKVAKQMYFLRIKSDDGISIQKIEVQ
jgi:hypothetical protein